MLVYNVTNKVDHSIASDWVAWMKDEHIPEVLATGCFTDATIHQLLETDESDGLTYAVQYRAGDDSLYKKYVEEFAPLLRQKALDRWGNRFIAFRSLMQEISKHA